MVKELCACASTRMSGNVLCLQHTHVLEAHYMHWQRKGKGGRGRARTKCASESACQVQVCKDARMQARCRVSGASLTTLLLASASTPHTIVVSNAHPMQCGVRCAVWGACTEGPERLAGPRFPTHTFVGPPRSASPAPALVTKTPAQAN